MVTGRRRRRGGAYVFCAVSGGCHGRPPLCAPPMLGEQLHCSDAKLIVQAAKQLAHLLPLALRFIGAWSVLVAQHDAGDTVCAPLGRARRTEAAETMGFMAMRMGEMMDHSPTASWWAVLIAGARFLQGQAGERASQSRRKPGSRPGRRADKKP